MHFLQVRTAIFLSVREESFRDERIFKRRTYIAQVGTKFKVANLIDNKK